MSNGFKMDPKDKRELSVPSDSCQVDILICERWGGSLLPRLHGSEGSQAVLEDIQMESRVTQGPQILESFKAKTSEVRLKGRS